MAVKVFIRRKVSKEHEEQLFQLITQLRSLATKQPGYISGETMRSIEDEEEYLVISTWESVDDWNAWKASDERAGIQKNVDGLLKGESRYEVYYHPIKGSARLSGFRGWEGG
ncbi:MAG TPA: antibiotic biosynthesis monooxygenase [Deltaproteobacteria bacterium]|nr:antibiotic biosynthesis monooxygenase [Deltaproteobacteria bacterium]